MRARSGPASTRRRSTSCCEPMEPLEVDKAALEIPRADRKAAHFLKPELVAEIAFTEFTTRRHPAPSQLHRAARGQAGQGRRDARRPRSQCPRPRPKARSTSRASASASPIPTAPIFPEEKLTKGDLADYYAAIEPLIMVDAANRPMTLIRCPQGRAKKCFFQKHDSGSFGEHVKHIPIKEKNGGARGLSLLRRHPRPARLRPDGHDRIPRLGQQGRQGRISRPAGVRPRPRRRARFRQGEGGRAAASRACSPTSGSRPSRC